MYRYFYHFRLQQSIYIWVIIAVGIYSLQYLWGYLVHPFIMRQNRRYPALVAYQACEVGDLPPHVTPYFLKMVPTLAAQGFVTLGCATRLNPENNQESYISLWVNRKEMDTAQIITAITPSAKKGSLVMNFVAFRTDFTDDTAFVTANSPYAGVFKPDPAQHAITIPTMRDIVELCRLHRARVAQHHGGRTPTVAQFKDAVSRLQEEYISGDATGEFQVSTRAGRRRNGATRKHTFGGIAGAVKMLPAEAAVVTIPCSAIERPQHLRARPFPHPPRWCGRSGMNVYRYARPNNRLRTCSRHSRGSLLRAAISMPSWISSHNKRCCEIQDDGSLLAVIVDQMADTFHASPAAFNPNSSTSGTERCSEPFRDGP